MEVYEIGIRNEADVRCVETSILPSKILSVAETSAKITVIRERAAMNRAYAR